MKNVTPSSSSTTPSPDSSTPTSSPSPLYSTIVSSSPSPYYFPGFEIEGTIPYASNTVLFVARNVQNTHSASSSSGSEPCSLLQSQMSPIQDTKLVFLRIASPKEVAAEKQFHRKVQETLDNVRSKDRESVMPLIDSLATSSGELLIYQDVLSESGVSNNIVSGMELLPVSNIAEFFNVAIPIARAVLILHESCILHMELNPFHILYNTETKRACLIGLEKAMHFNEKISIQNQNLGVVSQVCVQYIAPEQTGFTNNGKIRYNTDLYSLGATFYALLTGSPISTSKKFIDIVNDIITKKVSFPVDTTIPQCLRDIISKLLEKDEYRRYQTAYGLLKDLEKAKEVIETVGLKGTFHPGTYDRFTKFVHPKTLFDRDREYDLLRDVFYRVHNAIVGRIEVVAISGPAGIGKTVLFNKFKKMIPRKGALLGLSKFDQFRRECTDVIASLCTTIVSEILKESDDEIKIWKENILNTISPNGSLLIHMCPLLQSIIGHQPLLTSLTPTELERRSQDALYNLFLLFAKRKTLVLFVDDMQWCDKKCLQILENLCFVTLQNFKLLLVMTYRNESDNNCQPLIEKLTHLGPVFHQINLFPLGVSSVAGMLSASLSKSTEQCTGLAELIVRKTGGIPFFVKHFIRTLDQLQLIRYSHILGQWTWNLETIEKNTNQTENLILLLVDSIRHLSPGTMQFLQIAAVLGNTFNPQLIAHLMEKGRDSIEEYIQEALKEKLILQNTHYSFIHDRVQQAAIESSTPDGVEQIHLRIAKLLLSSYKDQLYDAAYHMNAALNLINNPEEVKQVVQLSIKAAKKAAFFAQMDKAFTFASNGMRAIVKLGDYWESHYSLAYQLTYLLAECTFYQADEKAAIALIDELLARISTNKEISEVYCLLIDIYIIRGDFALAINSGKLCLSLLGISTNFDAATFQMMYNFVFESLKKLDYQTLLSYPTIKDEDLEIKLNLLGKVLPALFVAEKELITTFTILGCYEYLKNKVSFVYESLFLSMFGECILDKHEWDFAYQISKLAIDLQNSETRLEMYNKTNVRVHHFSVMYFRKHSYYETSLVIQKTIEDMLKSYEIFFGTVAMGAKFEMGIIAGIKLETVYEEYLKFVEITSKFSMSFKLVTIPNRLVIEKLLGYPTQESEAIFKDRPHLPVTKALHFLFNSFMNYIMGQYEEALEDSLQSIEFIGTLQGYATRTFHEFVLGLSICACLRRFKYSEEKEKLLRENLDKAILNVEYYYTQCPINFKPNYFMLVASKALLTSDLPKAMETCKIAGRAAIEVGMLHIAGISTEFMAEIFKSLDLQIAARSYLNESTYYYSLWGAVAKLQQLRRIYPELIEDTTGIRRNSLPELRHPPPVPTPEFPSEAYNLSNVDLTITGTVLLKAAQALSQEIELSNLLPTVLRVVLECSGATSGAFILKGDDEELSVVVHGTYAHLSLTPTPLSKTQCVSPALINYVARSETSLMIGDISTSDFQTDEYFRQHPVDISVICSPIMFNNKLRGVLYVENNLMKHAFSEQRLHLIVTLSSQIAISLENALLYQESKMTSKLLAEKNKIKDDFLANTSHELRTPLFGILGMTSMLAKTSLSSEQEEYVNVISTCGNELLIHVDNLLDFMKLQNNKIVLKEEKFDFLECIESSFSAVCFRADTRNISLVFTPSPSIPRHIIGDVFRLKQVILNLLSNAIKYSYDSGLVTLSVTQVRTSVDRINLEFAVTDKGVGIPIEKRNSLFLPFVQLISKNFQAGTGLGLCVSQKLCEVMDGRIWLDWSEENKGSTFKFEVNVKEDLPRITMDESVLPQIDRTLENTPVLVFIESVSNADVLKHYLNLMKFKATFTSSADEFIKELDKSKAIRAVFIDANYVPKLSSHLGSNSSPEFIVFVLSTITERQHKDRLVVIPNPIPHSHLIEIITKPFLHHNESQISDNTSPEQQTPFLKQTSSSDRPKTVLITDDNPVNMRVLKRLVQKITTSPLVIDEAKNGKEAVDLTEDESKQYDLILMDIQMPVMNGMEATEKIRDGYSKSKLTPILGITASANRVEHDKYISVGMNDVLTKPFTLNQIKQAITQYAPKILE